jgi:hypothetical protein
LPAGATFYFEYAIPKPPSSGQKFLFFKVFMNGRHIVSWGIDLLKSSAGTTHRALYEPSERYRDISGVCHPLPGIEARSFRFVADTQATSVAEDGGLIEFQVFRAQARKRRAARLEQHRHQVKYGIA